MWLRDSSYIFQVLLNLWDFLQCAQSAHFYKNRWGISAWGLNNMAHTSDPHSKMCSFPIKSKIYQTLNYRVDQVVTKNSKDRIVK